MLMLAVRTFERDYLNETVINPLGAAIFALAALFMLALPRRYAPAPMLMIACFVAPAQRIAVFSLDLTLLRLMIVAGWIRILARREYRAIRWNGLDTAVVIYGVTAVAAFTILKSSFAGFVYRIGTSIDALGLYFLFRALIRDQDDLVAFIKAACWISLPLSLCFFVESRTGRNMFAAFGGVPEITNLRAGRLRCQGAFAHPILAGCFWASLLPLFVFAFFANTARRVLLAASIVSVLGIVFFCASSTPVAAVAFGIIAMCLYPVRKYVKYVRWGSVVLLVVLHLVMNAPVWHLLARVDILGGSTGHHRFKLINGAVEHFGEWWLVGTESTADWGLGLFDITNQYLLEAVRGGLVTLGAFIAIIVVAFRRLGHGLRNEHSNQRRLMMWGMGTSLWIHCTSFIAVSYFGQIVFLWWLTVASINSLLVPHRREEACRVADSATVILKDVPIRV